MGLDITAEVPSKLSTEDAEAAHVTRAAGLNVFAVIRACVDPSVDLPSSGDFLMSRAVAAADIDG
jgi:hypothetical protein